MKFQNLSKRVLIDSKYENSNYYELYSDGYIIQGGLATGSYADEGSLNITFLKKFNKTPYIEISNYSNIDRDGFESHIKSYSTIGFNCFFNQASSSRGTKGFFWKAIGY